MANVLEPLSKGEELRRLREFLRQLEDLLNAIVLRPENIIHARHHELLRAAWDQIQPRFQQLELGENHWSNLQQVGLTGAALLFELSIFNHARGELMDHAPEIFVPPIPSTAAAPPPPLEKPRGWWSRLRRLARRALEAGDIVLGSIGKVPVFGLPAEGIVQFKESIEKGAALADELDRQ